MIKCRAFRILLLVILTLYGCAVNPVTGRKEIALVSEGYELNIGKEQYGPSRQMQGGDYTVDRVLTSYVNRVGQKLAAVSDRSLPYEFVVLNNSTPNAWALPGGKVAINRGLLLELNNEAELAAVLGHEIVHAAARHGAKGMERGLLLQGALVATGIAFSSHDYARQVVGGAEIAATLLNQKYTRDAEREADYYGMKYMSRAGYDPQAAVSLQETFVRLSKEQRRDWLTGLFASHPPSQERVDANRQTARMLPAKGTLGTDPYQKAIAHLKKTQPAYKACDEARKALGSDKIDTAHALAEKALAIEPKEALFYGLTGDIQSKRKQYRNALDSYTRAIELNGNFFYYYIQRGLIRKQLNQPEGAKKDLERSIDLLPTATAYNALGNIAEKRGDRTIAKNYFKAAAGSRSEAGEEASASLVRLDLPDNPRNYLKVETLLNAKGYVFARISNPTVLPVGHLRLAVHAPDRSGKLRERILNVTKVISPGNSVTVPLGIGPVTGAGQLNAIGISILRAGIAD